MQADNVYQSHFRNLEKVWLFDNNDSPGVCLEFNTTPPKDNIAMNNLLGKVKLVDYEALRKFTPFSLVGCQNKLTFMALVQDSKPVLSAQEILKLLSENNLNPTRLPFSVPIEVLRYYSGRSNNTIEKKNL